MLRAGIHTHVSIIKAHDFPTVLQPTQKEISATSVREEDGVKEGPLDYRIKRGTWVSYYAKGNFSCDLKQVTAILSRGRERVLV